jgi:hypothetical protein
MGKNTLTNSFRPEQTAIKCLQVNLQHSRAATANLMRTIADEGTDIVFIQEPYIIQNKVIGISKKYRTYTGPEGRCRAAIVVANNKLDTMLIQQLSDADAVTVEITIGNLNIIVVSMYFDREKPIEPDLAKMEFAIQHAKGTAVLFATDSNARSTLWHDKFTNTRGRTLEEFLTSNQLYIVNKDSNNTTFRNSLGTSNIDLTIISTQLLNNVSGWTISDQESISDHNFIKLDIKQSRGKLQSEIIPKFRYKTDKESSTKFLANFHRILKTEFQIQHNDTNEEDLDDTLCSLMNKHTDVEKCIDDFSETIITACNLTFNRYRTTKKSAMHKTVPWWTTDLTVQRKRTNALRRLYQRTKNNDELRETRKIRYFESKATYSTSIKREKIRSWKEYCNMTTATNPWNIVYKLAAGKRHDSAIITTIRKPDGTLTASTKETLSLMMDSFTPVDNEQDDNEYHKLVRTQTQQPPHTQDDREFTIEEIRSAVESMNNRKAPGEDGITGDIFNQVFLMLPKFITAMYNGCLRNGIFPKRWKRAMLIPIIKHGKENSLEVTKYSPISLLNVGGKVLEKVLINRTNHYVFTNEYINKNQYGFMPQTSTSKTFR